MNYLQITFLTVVGIGINIRTIVAESGGRLGGSQRYYEALIVALGTDGNS